MARIRSVHPGQWTAGDFLECSPLARLLALALRNCADDNGAFRWKPKTIKAECLPADNCDIDALLAELIANDQVKRYAVDGKEYGLIIDFTQWQRPKKPKCIHPVPDWFSTSTEPVENHDGTASEIPPQREEVGGRREEDGGGVEERARERKSLISEDAYSLAGELLVAMGLDREHPLSVGAPMTVQAWLSGGWPPEVIKVGVEKAMQGRKHDPPGTLKYFEKAIARTLAEMSQPLPTVAIRQAEKLTVTHGTPQHRSGGSLTASLRRDLAALEQSDGADNTLPAGSILRLSN